MKEDSLNTKAMKIRNKIALIFILLTVSLLLIVFGFIYYFSYRYTQHEFYQRLRERAGIIAQSYFEKDELSRKIYNDIQQKYLQKLSDEREAVFRVDIHKQTILEDDVDGKFPATFFEEVFNHRYAKLKTGNIDNVGILYIDNQGDFIVTVSARNVYGQAKMHNLLNILLMAFLLSGVIIYVVGIFYAGKILRPISIINKKANEISVSNLHMRLETGNSKDELTELAITFNHMLNRLENAFKDRINFVYNASHELRNPLTVILGETEVALNKERSVEDYKNSLNVIGKEASRLSSLIGSLLKVAQTDAKDRMSLAVDSVRVDELLIAVKADMDNANPENHIVFDFLGLPSQPDDLIIRGNVNLLKAALTNIMDNACKFSMNKEVVTRIIANGNVVDIRIKDQGVGIPESDLENITEPFYRASNVRTLKGFGIGLSLTNKIIKLHGGTIHITSTLGMGTEVSITLPKS